MAVAVVCGASGVRMFSTLPRREFCRSGTKKNGVGFSRTLEYFESFAMPTTCIQRPLSWGAVAGRPAPLPVPLGRGFVDHGDERGFFVITAGEFTAGDKRNAHG